MTRRLRALLLAATFMAPTLATPILFAASPAYAQSRSSGGYSRGGTVRTPSIGSPSTPRTPGTSGGYRRGGTDAAAPAMGLGTSAADRAFNERAAAGALARMRESQERDRTAAAAAAAAAARPAAPPAPTYAPEPRRVPRRDDVYANDNQGGGFWTKPAPRRPRDDDWSYARGPQPNYYNGWQVPSYARSGSFGGMDAFMLWYMLSHMNGGGSDFFRSNADSAGYREWRAEADRLARDNADLRSQLNDLDRSLARRDGGTVQDPFGPSVAAATAPRREAAPAPAPVPSSAPVSQARPAQAESGGGHALLWIFLFLVLVGGGAFLFLRMRSSGARRGTGGTMDNVRAAADIVRHKASGQGYEASRFRVGMTLALDPTPFLLAGEALHAGAPASAQTSVEAVGRPSGAGRWVRLYLPGEAGVVAIDLAADGSPEAARLFQPLDRVVPADEEEWKVWLDDAEGMIGWNSFQTKDGADWGRTWSPGPDKVAPRVMREEIQGAGGSRTVTRTAMLYSRPTGAPAPAPEVEYLLVAAVEGGDRAWVEIQSGIDVLPAALGIA